MKIAIGKIVFTFLAHVRSGRVLRESLSHKNFPRPARRTTIEVSHERFDWLKKLHGAMVLCRRIFESPSLRRPITFRSN